MAGLSEMRFYIVDEVKKNSKCGGKFGDVPAFLLTLLFHSVVGVHWYDSFTGQISTVFFLSLLPSAKYFGETTHSYTHSYTNIAKKTRSSI